MMINPSRLHLQGANNKNYYERLKHRVNLNTKVLYV